MGIFHWGSTCQSIEMERSFFIRINETHTSFIKLTFYVISFLFSRIYGYPYRTCSKIINKFTIRRNRYFNINDYRSAPSLAFTVYNRCLLYIIIIHAWLYDGKFLANTKWLWRSSDDFFLEHHLFHYIHFRLPNDWCIYSFSIQ